MKIFTLLFLIICIAKPRQAVTPDKLLGTWKNENGDAKFEFFKTGNTY